MRAARIHRYGGQDAVVVDEIDRPKPEPGEVLVNVVSAGVNPVDWKIREGYMAQVMPLEFPFTLGCELAGVVAEVGANVTRFKPGDHVYGYPHLTRAGAFAEAAVLYDHELAFVPDVVSLHVAGGLPVAAITAMDGLFKHGHLEPGQTVLILGGSGGVGSAAIQLAKWKGAHVFATASTRNQQWLHDLGATPIDYTAERTADVVQDADLIFDTVGVEAAIEALPSLKVGGRLVSSVYALPRQEHLATRKATSAIYGIIPSGDRLSELTPILESGALRMAVDRVFTLDEVAEALEASRAGRTRGKLLVSICSDC